MAWRDKNGNTSDREYENACRRGTQTRTGTRLRQTDADRQTQSDQLDQQRLSAMLGWPRDLDRD